MKKLLSLEDLYNFYVSQDKNIKFNAKDENKTIVVHIDEPFNFEATQDDELNLYTNIRLCHLDENKNGSSISREVMEEAIPSAYNMPILGYIWHDEEDNKDKFASHEFYIDDGEIVYEEIPVGCIPESAGLKLVENENGKTYLEGKGLIWKTYTKAADILEREKNLSVSVELSVNSLSYNAKEKVMNIEDFKFSGVTILQAHRDDGSEVKPGMEGVEITIGDFSEQNNSVFAQKQVMEMLEEINQKLSNFNIEKSEGKEDANVDENVKEVNEEIVEEVQVEEAAEEEVATEEMEATEETPSEDEEKFSKTFELSHDDIRCGLYALLAPFEDTDSDLYWISDVYDDHFIYEGWFDPTHIFDQKYTRDGDNIAFEGDRIHMNKELLTDNELAELNAMRSNYEELQTKLQKYEDEPKKVEILESADYALIADNEEFKALKDEKAHFDLSIDELTAKCNEILLNAAKAGTVNFEATEKKSNFKALPMDKPAKAGRYGGLFKK